MRLTYPPWQVTGASRRVVGGCNERWGYRKQGSWCGGVVNKGERRRNNVLDPIDCHWSVRGVGGVSEGCGWGE